MNSTDESSPGKDRCLRFVFLEMNAPSVSVASNYWNRPRRYRRKQGLPRLTWSFSSSRRQGLQQRSSSSSHKMRRTTTYLFLLFMAASISTYITLVTRRSRLLLRQWQMEHSHPLSVQHQRQRQLRTQTRNPASFLLGNLGSPGYVHRKGAKLRYLAFGSSISWGSELLRENVDPSDSIGNHLEDSSSYPFLLDTDVYSVALPSSIMYADFAAACTQSIIDGTGVPTKNRSSRPYTPDVITVEYTSADILASHRVLIQRLRRRYPLSIIVLVQILDPLTHLFLQEDRIEKNVSDTKTTMSFLEWKNAHDRKQSSDSTKAGSRISSIQSEADLGELAQSMIQATLRPSTSQESQPGIRSLFSWTMAQPSVMHQQHLSELLETDPLLLHYSPTSNFTIAATTHDVTVATQQMIHYLSLFWMDKMSSNGSVRSPITLLSPHGHEQVATGIRSLVEVYMEQKNQRSHWYNPLSYRRTPKIGDWGSGDDCHLWYTTGNYNVEAVGGNPTNLPLVNNDAMTGFSFLTFMNYASDLPHKHVLEFSRSQPSTFDGTTSSSTTSYDYDNNYILVHNPFSTKRLLSLTYLADADGMSYPKTRVIVNDKPTVLIQPIHDDTDNVNEATDDEQFIGIARTSGVGYVPPGKSIVRLVPVQSTTLPFRLLGASILADEVQVLSSIEFALEADTLSSSIHQ